VIGDGRGGVWRRDIVINHYLEKERNLCSRRVSWSASITMKEKKGGSPSSARLERGEKISVVLACGENSGGLVISKQRMVRVKRISSGLGDPGTTRIQKTGCGNHR